MSNQDTVTQTQPVPEYSEYNNHQFELIDGEVKLVTYIADSILYEDPVYLDFLNHIFDGEERREEPTMTFRTDLDVILTCTIERELHRLPNGDIFVPIDEKKKYEMLREQLQAAIDTIDSLTFGRPQD